MSRALKSTITIDVAERPFEAVAEQFTTAVMAGDAVICPCCKRHNMICKRKITSAMAYQLQRMRTEHGRVFEGKELLYGQGGEWRMYSLLRFWGFIQREEEGALWRITAEGIKFVDGEIDAPHCALILNDHCIGFIADDRVTFKAALGDDFDLPEVFSVGAKDIEQREPAHG